MYYKKFSTPKICLGVGTLFLLLGTIGLISSDFAGGHFSFTMNLLHIFSGLIFFIVAKNKNEFYSYLFSIGGLIFTASLALTGIVLGEQGASNLGFNGQDPLLLIVIPKMIELGTLDHLINIVLAVIFIFGIYNYNNKESEIDKLDLDRFENEGGAIKNKKNIK